MKIPSLPKLSKRTWVLIAATLLVLAAIPGLGVVRFTSTHPFFCLSCHKNQEPRAMWLPSRMHPASTTCVDCHTPPGRIIPQRFSANDELMNENCLRCHPGAPQKEQKGLEDVRIVKISHKLHSGKKALCIDCHRSIEHDIASPRTNRPTMETCYHCHTSHPRSQACDTCHPILLAYTPQKKAP